MIRSCPGCGKEMDAALTECLACGHRTTPPLDSPAIIRDPSLVPGTLVDKKYRLIRRLGEGGMGEVWQAEHTLLRKEYALKLLGAAYSGDAKFQEKFLGEGRVLTELRHAKIVEAHDVGVTEGSRLYLVMELVPGGTLRDIMRREGKLSIADALWVARELLAVLDYAHNKGVIHRDLKPENLVVQEWGTPRRRLKILDFGIAKMVAEGMSDTTSSNTMAGWGTMQYMSPEQMMGDPVDSRTDLYAVGVILYEMLAGRRPLEAETGQKLAAKLLGEAPDPLSKHRPDVPPAIEAAVMTALSKEAEKRQETATEMLAELDIKLEPAPVAAAKPERRVGLFVAAGFAGAVLAAGLGATFLMKNGDVVAPPAVTPTEQAPVVEADTDAPIARTTRTEFPISQGSAYCVALSPDGRLLACGLDLGRVALWTLGGDSEPRTLEAGSNFIQAIAFSADGGRLAVGSGDSMIRIWERPFDGVPRELAGHDHVVMSLAFGPNGALLASAGADMTVKVWNVADGKIVASFHDHQNLVKSVAFSPDGTMVASGGDDNRVRLWSVAPPAAVHSFDGHSDAVRGVTFAADGRWIVSCGPDRTLRFWDVAAREPARKELRLLNEAYAVALSPKGRHLAVATGGKVTIYSTERWEPVQQLASESVNELYGVAWAAGGGRVAACGKGPAVVWELIP